MEMPTLPNPGLRSVFPVGLVVDEVRVEPNLISVRAHPAGRFLRLSRLRAGPRTASIAATRRQLLDLPSHGRAVQIRVTIRRFRCISSTCLRRILC